MSTYRLIYNPTKAMFWGRLSDYVGRKPVMLVGLFGMAISVIAFGLQKTYTGLLVSRFFAGMMNGASSLSPVFPSLCRLMKRFMGGR